MEGRADREAGPSAGTEKSPVWGAGARGAWCPSGWQRAAPPSCRGVRPPDRTPFHLPVPRVPSDPQPGSQRPAERGVRTELTACPHLPSAQVDAPFYEEWWFLLVMALSSLVVLLLVAFALVLHGQNRKYRSCSAGVNPPPARHLAPPPLCPLPAPPFRRP